MAHELTFSNRSDFFKPSQTLAITAKAKKLIASGESVISLAAGEPDFNTPDTICQTAIESIQNGFTKYTPTSGIPELKQAITLKLQQDNHILVTSDQIVVSVGAKHALYNVFQSLISPGDEVLLIAPYWTSYYEQVIMAGGVPVIINTNMMDQFIPKIEDAQAVLTQKTKLIVINSPNNPTGAVYPRKLLSDLAELAMQNNLWIISDEIYEKLVYDGSEHVSIASLSDDALSRTVTINGFSKSFAMTGWRIGYSVASKELSKRMTCMQDQVTSNPTSFAQKGACQALKISPDFIFSIQKTFQKRRDLMMREFSDLSSVKISKPLGAFYMLCDISEWKNEYNLSDWDISNRLLDDYGVAVIPGEVFGDNTVVRLSYATSEVNIIEGVKRIKDFARSLK